MSKCAVCDSKLSKKMSVFYRSRMAGAIYTVHAGDCETIADNDMRFIKEES